MFCPFSKREALIIMWGNITDDNTERRGTALNCGAIEILFYRFKSKYRSAIFFKYGRFFHFSDYNTNVEKWKGKNKMSFRKTTDMEAAKSIARTFVYLEPKIGSYGFVQHPFLKFEIYPANDVASSGRILNVGNPDDLVEIRSQLLENIEHAEKYIHLIFMLNTTYAGVFFKMSNCFLSEEDYSTALGYIWTTVEYTNNDPNVSKSDWIRFFKKANKELLIGKENLDKLVFIPEQVVIYRGLQRNASVRGLSWTLDLKVAAWFANRFDNNGDIYRATADRAKILAYFCDRGEQEIVIDPKDLINIEKI